MPTPNVLIVAVDGLRASALGAYGNTAFATPALDRFASESLLLDYCYAASGDLSDVYQSLWQSAHPLRPANFRRVDSSLPRLLAARGYESILVSDHAELSEAEAGHCFDQRVAVATPADEHSIRAGKTSHTKMARLFAAACDVVQQQSSEQPAAKVSEASPCLVWVHTRGMYGPWDAPLQLQESLLDEGDPPPVENAVPPEIELARADDPDLAFRYQCAYGAQVMVLDACWSALMEAVATAAQATSWLVVLMGIRGFPLGEHQRIGGVDQRLFGEQLHVPWLVRHPGGRGALARSRVLTSHLDLLPTILDYINTNARAAAADYDGESILPLFDAGHAAWRDWLISVSSIASTAFRTNDWCLRQDSPILAESSGDGLQAHAGGELYVRPDDRWEANDVAKLCSEVVEQFAGAIRNISQQIAEGRLLPTKALPKETLACE